MNHAPHRLSPPNPSATEPEVLVIGGGTAALCAAISARRAGASVCLLEQAPKGLRGGNTRHSRNLRFMHPGTTPLASGPYPVAEFRADLDRATGGTMDSTLTPLLIQHSADVPDWLEDAGVRFQPTASGVLPASRKTAFLLGGGKSMLNALYATAEGIGVEIQYAAEVRDLMIREGRLEQVLVAQGEQVRAWRPRAAIACCGGAQANRDWLRAQWGEAAAGFINRGTPFAEGQVLGSMLRQGAQPVGDPHSAYLVAVDARSPADDGGIVTRVRCMPAGIVVDRNGRRSHDEGGDTASTRYAVWGQRLAGYPGQIGYLILDARGMREAPPSLYPPISADGITTLAAALAIDPVALRTTIARYNAAVRPADQADDPAGWHTLGLDPPKSRQALPLTEPPFAAYPMRPGITFTYHGVRVDAQTRVRLGDGLAVENLFAAGMIMAPNIIGRGYVSGLAMTIGIVFGRLAGEEAARRVQG
ncbi:FAD-dependent tricarballylate dehydrogenase TcuA [Thiocystis violacea]|uniref:FAD-dependent tricarballylate dehydrogenase TcuA n=1 Tax=Thiocystis violacea TaxID=13725 RepID=UPI001908BE7E|nr:FAD-dependent tricarballylate dehydrogenase TcuA [Thiocystis violacea]MBK1721286.1 tricarballylate dehydrogenase [Thiocystis violacea]